MDHLAQVGLDRNCIEGGTEFLLPASTFLSPHMASQCDPYIRECLYCPRSEKTHLTSALTNCPARRETLGHCSLGRSMCCQPSSGTSQRTGTGETHQLQLQPLSISQGEGLLFWRMADNDFSAVFSAPEIPQSIHLRLAIAAASSSRALFEKSVLGSSNTPHQWMQGDQHLPFSNTMFRNTINKFLNDLSHSWLSKQQLPPTILWASLLPAYGFPSHPQHSG